MSGLPLSGYVWGRIVLGEPTNLKGWKVHFLSRPRGAPRPPKKHPEPRVPRGPQRPPELPGAPTRAPRRVLKRPPGPVQGLVFAFYPV